MDPNQYMLPPQPHEYMDEHGNRYFQYQPDQYVFFVPSEHHHPMPMMNSVIPLEHMKTKAKAKPEKPQRAYNSFIWYRKDKIKDVIKQNPDMSQTKASQLVAEMWRKETDEVKAIYKAKYEQHKREIDAAEAAKRQQKEATQSPVPTATQLPPAPAHHSLGLYGAPAGLHHPSQTMVPRVARDCGTISYLNGVPNSPWARRRSRTMPGNMGEKVNGAIRHSRKKDSVDLRRQATSNAYSMPGAPVNMSPSMHPSESLSLNSSPLMMPMNVSMPPMGHFDMNGATSAATNGGSIYASPMLSGADPSAYFNNSTDAFPPMPTATTIQHANSVPTMSSYPANLSLQKTVSAEPTFDPNTMVSSSMAMPTGYQDNLTWMEPHGDANSIGINQNVSGAQSGAPSDFNILSSAQMAAQVLSGFEWKAPQGVEDSSKNSHLTNYNLDNSQSS
ncbi:hypothetical protein H4219_005311 [Mycoemilia scoparia]|uniref:HMG box domain-containing protein n=1 Tax=Mycoemilia scoparia TaxID=417184 RepID=A0A9W7ZPJ6_9FUNG|nr:hypothetical protein H4219_005311 [Mycoemilia scoparia]